MSISEIKRCSILAISLLLASVVAGASLKIEDLGISVSESREYSFSDKYAGFYYGMTGDNDFSDGNAGWTIDAKRVFNDYRLFVDGVLFDRATSKVVVYPDGIVRTNGDVTETFQLVDGQKLLFVKVDAPEAGRLQLSLSGGNLQSPRNSENGVVCPLHSFDGKFINVIGYDGSKTAVSDGVISVNASAGGFIVVFGEESECAELAKSAVVNREKWLSERRSRMQTLLDNSAVNSNSDKLDKSLAWILLTADELVTWQHGGWGIYAGFPWFTDFWGRDMFIAMPGTALCSGQFDVARNILLSFAKFQDSDPKSPTYGRVPNRLNLDGILYNTTDGTPRFVLQVLDYLRYTGDVDFVKKIYNNVKVATDSSLKLYADSCGYLTHADADTWMDAKRQSLYPCSPRGNRAVDIQALWYGQLMAARTIALCVGEKADARRWEVEATKLSKNFQNDFLDGNRIVDHLNADNTKDWQLRPNTMFDYDLIDNDSIKVNDIKTLWSKLTYPWGVSSLDQMDGQFHPYHEQWHRYHKDDAYHNGTVWLWLNGMAMQRMIEFGQVETAFKLFVNMNRQALDEGAVGSLSECADAWCRPGKTWARRSGTFLQSWSNSEQLRVWNQYFLGVRPDFLNGKLLVAPRLPQAVSDAHTCQMLGKGSLKYDYSCKGESHRLDLTLDGIHNVNVVVDLPLYGNMTVNAKSDRKITVVWDSLSAQLLDVSGIVLQSLRPNEQKKMQQERYDAALKNVDFAQPCYRENLKSMSRYFDPPLDYNSVE